MGETALSFDGTRVPRFMMHSCACTTGSNFARRPRGTETYSVVATSDLQLVDGFRNAAGRAAISHGVSMRRQKEHEDDVTVGSLAMLTVGR